MQVLQEGTWGQGGSTLHYPLYDRQALLSTRTNFELFNAQVGDTRNGAVLTDADTNNPGGRGLPRGQAFMVHQVQFAYLAQQNLVDAELLNVVDMVSETVVTFRIDGIAPIFRVPLWMFFGNFQGSAVPAAPLGQMSSFIQGNRLMGAWTLAVPIKLEEQAQWVLEVEHVTAPAAALDGDFVSFVLDGQLWRRGA